MCRSLSLFEELRETVEVLTFSFEFSNFNSVIALVMKKIGNQT